MLTWLMAMSVAAETPKIVTLPKRARPVATVPVRKPRKATKRKAAAPPPVRMTGTCLTGVCKPDVTDRYRVTAAGGADFSGKMDVMKPAGVPCGVQGAPVCPSKGRELVHTPID